MQLIAPLALVCTVIGVAITSGSLGSSLPTDAIFATPTLTPTPAPTAAPAPEPMRVPRARGASVTCDVPAAPAHAPLAACAPTALTRELGARFAGVRAELLAARDAPPRAASTAQAAWRRRHGCVRGVNLGSWLLVERWMVPADEPVRTSDGDEIPSPFSGERFAGARDEWTLSQLLREAGEVGALGAFRAAFVSRADFERIACLGLNAVRVPLGYWLVADAPSTPYVRGAGLRQLDDAIGWADELGIRVLLDVHGAPGGQNGAATSGHADVAWSAQDFDVDAAVDIVRLLAQRYARSRAVVGLELLNEPRLPAPVALRYYARAIAAVRLAGMRAADVAIVLSLTELSALLEPASVWRALRVPGALPDGENVLLDVHLHYALLPALLDELPLCYVLGELVDKQAELLDLLGFPTLVGEWSLRVPWRGPHAAQFDALSAAQQGALLAAFAQRQVRAYAAHNASVGGFFWAWRAPSSEAAWSYEYALARGWLAKDAWPSSCPSAAR